MTTGIVRRFFDRNQDLSNPLKMSELMLNLSLFLDDLVRLAYGSYYGNEINTVYGGCVQNTWYEIADNALTYNQMYRCTQGPVPNGRIIVPYQGIYMVNWAGSFECSQANKHIQIAITQKTGAGANVQLPQGMNHFDSLAVGTGVATSGCALVPLLANDAVSLSIRTTDAGSPNITFDHLMLVVYQIGG